MKRNALTKLFSLLLTMLCAVTVLTCCTQTPPDSSSDDPSSESSSPLPDDSSDEEISDGRVYWIDIEQDEINLFVGEEFPLAANLYCGADVVTGATFTWDSLDENVATVDTNGKLKAVGVGETMVKICAVGYENTDTFITVKCNADLTLDLSDTELELGKVALFGYENTAEISYEVKWQKELVSDAQIELTTSNDNVTATLADGKISLMAKEIGESVITAKYTKDGNVVETDILVSVIKPVLSLEEVYLFSAGKKNTIDLSLIEATEDFTVENLEKVTSADADFPIVEKSGSIVTISETESLGYSGRATGITLEFSDFEVEFSLKSYTHVIRTPEDFDYMKNFLVDTTAANGKAAKIIEGYYILANDIDFGSYTDGYASPFGYYDIGDQSGGYTHGWSATFDGNGHQIKNLKLAASASPWRNSLFGIIKGANASLGTAAGVIKDVAFVNCSMADGLRGSSFLANRVFGTVENVYLDVTLTTSHNYAGNAILIGYNDVYGLEANAKIGTFKNVTVMVGGLGANDFVMKGSEVDGLAAIKDSIIVIGAEENKVHNLYTDIADLKTANGNVIAYVDVAGAKKDNVLSTNGSVQFSVVDELYSVEWNGVNVYREPKKIVNVAEKLYSIEEATIDLSDIDGLNVEEIDSITRNGVNVTFTLNGQVATISGDDVLNGVATKATGAVTTIVVSAGSAKYNLPLKVCTDVIDTAAEFDEMKKFLADTTAANGNAAKIIEGYYILGADLDFAKEYPNGYASPFGYVDVGDQSGAYTHGWSATFDGNGHTISGLKLIQASSTWRNSLFGVIKGVNASLGTAAGVIKDVAFVNCSVAGGLYGSAFLANVISGTVENVYLEVTLNTTHTNAAGNAVLVRKNASDQSIYAASISNVTVVVNGLSTNDYVMVDKVNTLTTIKGSVVVIGAAENKIHNMISTISELTAANNNMKAYTSVANASNDTTLTTCGEDITFATTGDAFTIAWKGKTVYSGEIIFELEEQLYSISDASIDFSKLGIEVNENTVITRNGVNVTFTLNGQVATISGDDVLNGVATKAIGAVTTITVLTDTAKYNVPLKVCTDVLYTAADFDAMRNFLVDTTTAAKANTTDSGYCKIIKGYYILGADLDFAKEYPNGYASPFGMFDIGDQTGGYTHGWEATFDGNGHTISGLKLIKSGNNWRNSLFGIIKGDDSKITDDTFGVIKDVAFINCSMAEGLYGSSFFANRVYGTVENVYLDVTLTTNTGHATGNSILIGYNDVYGIEPKGAGTFNNITIVVGGLGASDYVMKGADATVSAFKSSIVIIGAAENKIHNKIATISELTAANNNIKAYTSAANASGDTTLTTCGEDITFATTGDTFTIVWKGKTVYSEALSA